MTTHPDPHTRRDARNAPHAGDPLGRLLNIELVASAVVSFQIHPVGSTVTKARVEAVPAEQVIQAGMTFENGTQSWKPGDGVNAHMQYAERVLAKAGEAGYAGVDVTFVKAPVCAVSWSTDRTGGPTTRYMSVDELMADNAGFEESAWFWIQEMLAQGSHNDSDERSGVYVFYVACDKDELRAKANTWLSNNPEISERHDLWPFGGVER